MSLSIPFSRRLYLRIWLAVVGGKLKDVVKLTYYVTDLSLREEANRQFERLFAERLASARAIVTRARSVLVSSVTAGRRERTGRAASAS